MALLPRFFQLSLKNPITIFPACYVTQLRYCHVYNDPNYRFHGNKWKGGQKHKDPKFKKDRKLKFIKIDFPDPNEKVDTENMTSEEIRAKMKEKELQPTRPWQEKPIYISCTTGTVEPYVPPEGDGKVSITTKAGAKQKFERMEKKGKSMMAVRKIRQYEENFDPQEFAEQAQQIYIDTHEALMKFDKDKLHQLVTERAFPLVTHEAKHKTLRWQFVKSLEPPHLVHARCADIITKENIFAQVTVRLHTQQTLAVYDRFGRLQYGSEVVARDVLEYIVFEKHISHTYGSWRIHDKIIPEWAPPRQPILRTYRENRHNEEENDTVSREAELSVTA